MKRFVIISAVLFSVGSVFAVHQDQPRKLAHFAFTIERTSKGVSLECERGCAWKTLGFTLGGTEVFIDQNGMVDAKRKQGGTEGFLVGIAFSDGKMELSCKTGCAWKTLGYTSLASIVRKVDEFGVGPK